MNLSRRGFLGSLLAVVSASAIVRVESLMTLPAPTKITIPDIITLQGQFSSFRVGDIVTFEGVERWDRMLNVASGKLRQFVVTKEGPFTELAIYPPLVTEGPYRTIVEKPEILLPQPFYLPPTKLTDLFREAKGHQFA